MTDIHLVVGANGGIGSRLLTHLCASGYDAVGTSRGRHDLLPFDLAAHPIDWKLPASSTAYLLAGITSIERCEADPAGTRRINVDQTLELTRTLASEGAHIVYVSTNLVLAGDCPLAKTDAATAPGCEYASQKTAVERALLEGRTSATILRITKVAEGLEGLLQGWARKLKTGQPIAPFKDLVCAPMPLARVVEALATLGTRKASGLYQLGGDVDISYAEIAMRLARRMGIQPALVTPVESAAAGVRLYAKPTYTTLDSTSTLKLCGMRPITTEATVEDLIARVVSAVQSVE